MQKQIKSGGCPKMCCFKWWLCVHAFNINSTYSAVKICSSLDHLSTFCYTESFSKNESHQSTLNDTVKTATTEYCIDAKSEPLLWFLWCSSLLILFEGFLHLCWIQLDVISIGTRSDGVHESKAMRSKDLLPPRCILTLTVRMHRGTDQWNPSWSWWAKNNKKKPLKKSVRLQVTWLKPILKFLDFLILIEGCWWGHFSGSGWPVSVERKLSKVGKHGPEHSGPQWRQRRSVFLEWPCQSPDLNLLKDLWWDLEVAVEWRSP